ncbi:hypothetical protein B484DRAFT_417365 [Ochromonadaceae sp. CCMP2298]|nr:hypothetical protein B484DRAFT_417365 [Ochromonadaceae sp. CCMP2298]|mmetsp:Transcript_9795/g.21789  ORF Transcript_9795/g.21789 Transcript_9795/m.21789 type:complete len:641 (-) Transcript_9795:128-2050(-)
MEEIQEWLDQQPIAIWCEDPETNHDKLGTGVLAQIGKSYLTYRILMKQVGRDVVGVRHRYSEFEALRKSLRDRYGPLGILVPSLPPKDSLSSVIGTNQKQTFIKERTLGLTLFCELVIASPWLRNDSEWKDFLKPKTGGLFAPDGGLASSSSSKASSIASALIGSTIRSRPVLASPESENAGEMKLYSCLSLLEVPYKHTMPQRIEDVRMEMLQVEKFARPVLEKVRVLQASERAYCNANSALATALKQWVAVEGTAVKTLGGKTFDETEGVLFLPEEQPMHSVDRTADLLQTKAKLLDQFPTYTGICLAVMVGQELALVDALRDLLRTHDEMVAGIESVAGKIVKAEASRSVNKFEVVAEQRIVLEERQACLTAFYKGFIFFSLPTCARQRAASLRKFSSAHASANLTAAHALYGACLTFFTEMSLSPTSAVDSTCRMLELLRVTQLERLPEDDEDGAPLPRKFTPPQHLGTVDLCAQSTGVVGLLPRAMQIIAQAKAGNGGTFAVRPAAVISSTPATSGGGSPNPLAKKRGAGTSAVASFAQQHQFASAASASAASTSPTHLASGSSGTFAGAQGEGSSLMSEVPDDMLMALDIRPSEDIRKLVVPVPLKDSAKSRSLLADLTGGGGAAGSKSVWEDV